MTDLDDICYECTGYGDDYYYDEETGELESGCETCWVTEWRENE